MTVSFICQILYGGLMRRFKWQAFVALTLSSLSACTYIIQPAVPTPQTWISGSPVLDCKTLFLKPEEFVNREYVSSFEGREIRLRVGLPATKAIEALVRSRISHVETLSVVGDGTLDFVRLISQSRPDSPIVIRPRFVQLASSLRPFRYNIEFGLTVDIAGLSSPVAPSGVGIGTFSWYAESEIQKAADYALSEAVASLAANFPTTCE